VRHSALTWLLSFSLLFGVFQTARSDEGALIFRHHDKEVGRFTQAQLKELSSPVTVRIYEPHVDGQRTYRAIPLAPILKSVYGPAWQSRGSDLVFTGGDGYQSVVAVEEFSKAPTLLAFGMASNKPFGFTHIRPPHQKVTLGPYYLIWNFNSTPELRSDEDYSWPYKVIDVDLINFQDRYSKMLPPTGSPAAVTRGFQAFRSYCMNCHQVGGQGGAVGPELNTAETYPSDWYPGVLSQYLLDPQAVQPETQMPGLLKSLPQREEIARDIIRYLEALEERSCNTR
jgi:cytochrome c2